MNATLNGITYNTDTAKLIPLVSASGHEDSNAGWHLYQMPSGACFKVSYGHEGEEIGCAAIDHQVAYKLAAAQGLTL